MIDREQHNSLQRAKYAGYRQGRDRRWPDWMPPLPPNKEVSRLISAAINLRNAVDGELAVLGENDSWQRTLGDPMDELTEALCKITRWLETEAEHATR